ncbi:MAG: hypothetical protein V7K41_21470 [Nostoc sp.]|uniref:hypothetical protein n=1 Tax=Nostoc sp. TaxID=1180 RepID=UPI002FF79305
MRAKERLSTFLLITTTLLRLNLSLSDRFHPRKINQTINPDSFVNALTKGFVKTNLDALPLSLLYGHPPKFI